MFSHGKSLPLNILYKKQNTLTIVGERAACRNKGSRTRHKSSRAEQLVGDVADDATDGKGDEGADDATDHGEAEADGDEGGGGNGEGEGAEDVNNTDDADGADTEDNTDAEDTKIKRHETPVVLERKLWEQSKLLR